MSKVHRQKLHEQRVAWESWQPILRTKLEGYDHLLECIKSDLSAAGMKKADGEQFLFDRITEMIEDIRAEKKRKAV